MLLEVAVITMHKAPVNSLSLETLTELKEAIEQAEDTKGCQGLVLTSVPKVTRKYRVGRLEYLLY